MCTVLAEPQGARPTARCGPVFYNSFFVSKLLRLVSSHTCDRQAITFFTSGDSKRATQVRRPLPPSPPNHPPSVIVSCLLLVSRALPFS
jgi:hypothetical protein